MPRDIESWPRFVDSLAKIGNPEVAFRRFRPTAQGTELAGRADPSESACVPTTSTAQSNQLRRPQNPWSNCALSAHELFAEVIVCGFRLLFARPLLPRHSFARFPFSRHLHLVTRSPDITSFSCGHSTVDRGRLLQRRRSPRASNVSSLVPLGAANRTRQRPRRFRLHHRPILSMSSPSVNRYPTPGSVRMSAGSLGSSCSFCLSWPT